MVQDVVDEKELAQANGNGHANGKPVNGAPRGPIQDAEDEQTDENIFVFVPNLIGRLTCDIHKCDLNGSLPFRRLWTDCAMPRIPLLHAVAPQTMQLFILHFLPARCS